MHHDTALLRNSRNRNTLQPGLYVVRVICGNEQYINMCVLLCVFRINVKVMELLVRGRTRHFRQTYRSYGEERVEV